MLRLKNQKLQRLLDAVSQGDFSRRLADKEAGLNLRRKGFEIEFGENFFSCPSDSLLRDHRRLTFRLMPDEVERKTIEAEPLAVVPVSVLSTLVHASMIAAVSSCVTIYQADEMRAARRIAQQRIDEAKSFDGRDE